MLKKSLLIFVAIIMVLSCFVGCTTENNNPTPTEAPATDAPTAAPTDTLAPTEEPTATPVPTEKPTEAPKIEILDVDAVITDMSTDVDISAFTKSSGVSFEKDVAYAYVGGADADDAFISLRPYDMRLIDAVLEDNPDADRTLADGVKYCYFAICYRVEADVVLNGRGFGNSTDGTNAVSNPPDTIAYDSKPYIQDGQWHVLVFNMKEEMPNAYALCQTGDPFDCVTIPVPNDPDSEYLIAWYGCFQSEEDINAWNANYAERFAKDLK